MVPEEVAAAGPGPLSPHHHSALKPHESVPHHWSPVHTAPSPETVGWTKNNVYWQNKDWWHIYKQFMEKYVSPWPVCPSEPVWQLSQCRPLLSARPAWPLLSTTGPRCLCLQGPPLSQHPLQELQLSCSVSKRGLSQTENTTDSGAICLSGSHTERSILYWLCALLWSDQKHTEESMLPPTSWSGLTAEEALSLTTCRAGCCCPLLPSCLCTPPLDSLLSSLHPDTHIKDTRLGGNVRG